MVQVQVQPQSPLEAYYNTYNYTIEEVAKLINRAKDLPIFDNTVFIVVGDHRPDVIVKYEKYSELRKEFNVFQQHLVPLLIYAPKVIRSNNSIESRVSSQLDILPTVLDIVGIKQPTMAMGQSLIRQDFYSQRIVKFPAHEGYRFDALGANKGKLYKLDDKANIISEHQDDKLLAQGKKFMKDRESFRIYFRDVIF